jgi:hypothetical protein
MNYFLILDKKFDFKINIFCLKNYYFLPDSSFKDMFSSIDSL